MKFIRQRSANTCQIVAIQQVLSISYFFVPRVEIRNSLPRHSFGNWITEIGIYLEHLGYKTRLISNNTQATSSNRAFMRSLDAYRQVGKFEDRLVQLSDLSDRPVILNVDFYAIGRKKGKPTAHYVVALPVDDKIWLYDGSNHKRRVVRSFSELQQASMCINMLGERGMWLFL